MIGLVNLIGRLSAMNLAKSLILLEKNYFNHRAPMQRNGIFCRKSYLPASLTDPILKNRACCSFLLNSFQAIAPLTGHEKGVTFLKGHISLTPF
jgi:hypothetical protein